MYVCYYAIADKSGEPAKTARRATQIATKASNQYAALRESTETRALPKPPLPANQPNVPILTKHKETRTAQIMVIPRKEEVPRQPNTP
jgi:hypothetical protein